MLEISNSSLTTFNTCNKKWWWQYVQKLKPRKRASALTLGDVIHKAFDRFYKGEEFGAIQQFIDDVYKKDLSNLPLEEQEPTYLDSKMAMGMFLNYPYKNLKFDEISSEVEFSIPIDKGITFVGRADGLCKHRNADWVREIKTTSDDATMFEKKMDSSGQITGYVWAMRQQTGKDIKGTVCEFIKKHRLQKRVDECMEEFGQRIYMDYCNPKKTNMYYRRFYTYRSPKDIDRWMDDTLCTCKRIKQCQKDGEFHRNTNACWAYKSECPYYKVCFADKIDPMVLDLFYDGKETK